MNTIFPVSSRRAERHGDLILNDKMATLPLVARHDNVTTITAFIFVFAVLIVFTIIPSISVAKKKVLTLKLAYVAPVGTFNHDVGLKFKEYVEKLSEGKIKVSLFPGGQLGNIPQMFGQLKKGSIDLFKTDLGAVSILAGGKSLSVVLAPYLFRDQNHFEKFCDSPIFQELMEEIEDKNGIKWGGLLADRSPRALTTRKTKVVVPLDVKGRKIRVPKSSIIPDIVKAWGASAAVLAAPEIYSSLKQKVVDGQENGVEAVIGMRLYQVQKYFTATDHIRSAECLYANKKKWDSLSLSQKEVIIRAARMVREWGDHELKSKTQTWFDLCRKNGMTIVIPPLKPWIEASSKVVKRLDGKMWPKGLYAKIQNIE